MVKYARQTYHKSLLYIIFVKSLVNSVIYSIYVAVGVLTSPNHIESSISMNFYFM